MFIAIVWVLHVAKLLSPIPEHVVADAHAEPGSQSQPERFNSSVFSAKDLVAIPKIMHDHCSTHTISPGCKEMFSKIALPGRKPVRQQQDRGVQQVGFERV